MSDYDQPLKKVDDRWQCFTYLTVDKAEQYRAIVEIFAAAKKEFVLHLRPAEILGKLMERGTRLELSELEVALDQLTAWGNLQSYKDNADVASLADFYRKKLLFQLSAAGEAAYAATLAFERRLGDQAKLDARALERITDAVAQLVRLSRESELDGPLVLTTLRNICQDADDLTNRAQSFFRWLHERTETEQAELVAFLHYKEQLIEYLRHFIGELIARAGEIASRLAMIDGKEVARLAEAAAQEDIGEPAVGADAFQHAADLDRSREMWMSRLMGLYGWFVSRDGRPPQSEQLRAAARAAIPRLLMIASQINQSRLTNSNRPADLRRLAAWFAGAANDAAAHRLFREAFVNSPARHLRVDLPTLHERDQCEVRPETSWLDAPPIKIAPQLRMNGRQPAGSASRRVIDRSAERAAIRRQLDLDANREELARECLVARGRIRLSEFGHLNDEAFRMLLELMELAVAPPGKGEHVCAVSRDGSLQLTMEAVDQSTAMAAVQTKAGCLHTQDMWVEVSRVH